MLKYLSEKSNDKAKFQFSSWPPKEVKMLNENKNTENKVTATLSLKIDFNGLNLYKIKSLEFCIK